MWLAYSSNLLWFGLAPFLEAGTPPTHTPWSSLLIKKFTSQYYDISSLRDLGQTNKKGFFVNLVWPSLRMITGVWLKMLWISSIIQDLLSRSNFIIIYLHTFFPPHLHGWGLCFSWDQVSNEVPVCLTSFLIFFFLQIVSLAQVLLDPYFRTMDGFQVSSKYGT